MSILYFKLVLWGITLRNIYFDAYAGLNTNAAQTSMEMRMVVTGLWGLFTIDIMASIKLSGGIGFFFQLRLGDDCHGQRNVGIIL